MVCLGLRVALAKKKGCPHLDSEMGAPIPFTHLNAPMNPVPTNGRSHAKRVYKSLLDRPARSGPVQQDMQ